MRTPEEVSVKDVKAKCGEFTELIMVTRQHLLKVEVILCVL